MSETKRQATRANRKAEEATADLVDRRLTKAIAHPLRLQILALANQRTISPSEYSDEMGASLSTVAYHFRKLFELGFLELVEEVPKRGSREHRYRSRRGLVKAGSLDSRDDSIFYWVGGGMDETGWGEFVAASRQLIARVKEIESASAARAADGGEACFPTTFAVAAFESPTAAPAKS